METKKGVNENPKPSHSWFIWWLLQNIPSYFICFHTRSIIHPTILLVLLFKNANKIQLGFCFLLYFCMWTFLSKFTPFVACNCRLAAEAKVNIFNVQGKLKCIGMIYLHHENTETVLLAISLFLPAQDRAWALIPIMLDCCLSHGN